MYEISLKLDEIAVHGLSISTNPIHIGRVESTGARKPQDREF